jgi:hypothetical protein
MNEDVPSVPSLVPSLFPLLSNRFLAFPVFRMFWHDPYGCNGLFVVISSATGNIGNKTETA